MGVEHASQGHQQPPSGGTSGLSPLPLPRLLAQLPSGSLASPLPAGHFLISLTPLPPLHCSAFRIHPACVHSSARWKPSPAGQLMPRAEPDSGTQPRPHAPWLYGGGSESFGRKGPVPGLSAKTGAPTVSTGRPWGQIKSSKSLEPFVPARGAKHHRQKRLRRGADHMGDAEQVSQDSPCPAYQVRSAGKSATDFRWSCNQRRFPSMPSASR